MSLSYEAAGVSISQGNAWVGMIKNLLSTAPDQPEVLGGIGGFAGLYRISEDLCLAACCDGVGTKMELGREWNRMDHLGQDLVAMNVNDLVTCGARPLFFLDYLSCGALNAERYKPVMQSILQACTDCGCALLGGETAEMPGVYSPEGFDLAGFAVGLVASEDLITGKDVAPGDILVGLPSSGVHSNGFSLVRKALEGKTGLSEKKLHDSRGNLTPLQDLLMAPTKLYVRQALEARKAAPVKAMAHITGGGLEENIARVCGTCTPHLSRDSWDIPEIFSWLASQGIEEEEMFRVFNMGIGFVFVISPEQKIPILDFLEKNGEKPRIIGEVHP